METKTALMAPTLGLSALLLLLSSTANAAPIHYNATLGTLPDAQGFVRIESDGAPAPHVAGGSLHQFPLQFDGVQYWQSGDIVFDFEETTRYAVEFELKVSSANYTPDVGTGPRFGYYVAITDLNGRAYYLGITEEGVALDTDVSFGPENDFVVSGFDTTDSYHTYRLSIEANQAQLFIDNSLMAVALEGSAVVPPGAPLLLFGDLSGFGISETDLSRISASPVPLPPAIASLLAATTVLVTLAKRSRRLS